DGFATAIIALLFTKLGLVRASTAGTATLFATVVFLAGDILGTLHHLYFAGTTEGVLAIGAMVSALEVVPLVLLGFEAAENYRHSHATSWMRSYRWPVLFFVRSEEHTSELQSRENLVCRLLLEK